MPVNPTIIAAVQCASPELLLTAGAMRLGPPRGVWPLLGKTSLIRDDKGLAYAELFSGNNNPGVNVVNELADYLELSTWAHVFDGWRYLSQAANALLRASRGRALHLAYYAELRAAMCILACSGVAILKNRHYSIKSNGELAWFNGSTHQVAWEALNAWSDIQSNAVAAIEALHIDSFLGVEWIDLCRTGHSPGDIASHWLKNWSIDLALGTTDRDARNEASYRPNLFNDAMLQLKSKDIRAVRSAAFASLHSVADGFTEVQAVLVSDLCKKSADFRFGSCESKDEQFWRGAIRWLMAQQSKSIEAAREITHYVRGVRDCAAGRLLELTDPSKTDAYSVFARAFFMLHLASAISLAHRDQMNLRAPGGKARWPEAIVRQYGLQANVWEVGAILMDRSSIEADAESAVDAIDKSLASQNSLSCPKSYWKTNAVHLNEVAGFERCFVSMSATA
jgi:hypothetical protein